MKRCLALLAMISLLSINLAHAHGGGCRKSSPPGQCCHMDNRTGQVHCH
ncbi:hypothetical protein PZ897_14335 [Hoeflea sp. YIM 152468]|nr:hypothetical protein [Hoeflea sp. YIM 152468]MDF1609360.1 hypothetical protein [Hoeflea sp. YIM 152468]